MKQNSYNTVAVIPIKENSVRVKKKNFIKINNIPLYQITIKKVLRCNFDAVFVDSDSLEIKKYCDRLGVNFIERLPKLSKNSANGNDLLNYHAKIIDAKYYFQIFITAPLLKVSTINKCINILKKNKKHDSILTANSLHSWFWYRGKPINYSPRVLPRSQDATPVVVETTGLYGIKKKQLIKLNCRVGKKPYFYEVGKEESIDLDSYEDFSYLKFLMKTKKN